MIDNCLKSSIVADVESKQGLDYILVYIKEVVLKKFVKAFSEGEYGLLKYQGHLCVPNVYDLRENILYEVHSLRYSIQPRATKMYRHLGGVFWWNGVKKNIAEFVNKFPNYEQVKVEDNKQGGLSLDINIPT